MSLPPTSPSLCSHVLTSRRSLLLISVTLPNSTAVLILRFLYTYRCSYQLLDFLLFWAFSLPMSMSSTFTLATPWVTFYTSKCGCASTGTLEHEFSLELSTLIIFPSKLSSSLILVLQPQQSLEPIKTNKISILMSSSHSCCLLSYSAWIL